MNSKQAVVLLSGGLDSATALGIAVSNGFRAIALTVHYGQRHSREIEAASRIAEFYGVSHHGLELPLSWKGSALLDQSAEVPKNRDTSEMSAGIPATYVPARNTVLISLAASLAEAEGADTIFIGANAVDYSGYPDCRPDYFCALEAALCKGTKCGSEGRPIKIETPLIHLTKSGIIRIGMSLGVPYELTWSCYEGGARPCGECDACRLRQKGFRELGAEDPLLVPIQSAERISS